MVEFTATPMTWSKYQYLKYSSASKVKTFFLVLDKEVRGQNIHQFPQSVLGTNIIWDESEKSQSPKYPSHS